MIFRENVLKNDNMTKHSSMPTRKRNLSEGDSRQNDVESTDHPATSGSGLISSQSQELIPLNNADSLFTSAHAGPMVECFISLANDQMQRVEVEGRAIGNDVLTKVCQALGIVEESEYFGLQYRGKYREIIWLNLRNKISRQLAQNTPYRLDLRVKYFVQPHNIISDETRHQFYLHARNLFVDGCWVSGVPVSEICQVIALMTQADYGNYHLSTSGMKYALLWPKVLQEEITSQNFKEIADFHQGFRDLSKEKAEYEVLRSMADTWIMYGVTFYDVTSCFGKSLKLGVGPDGVYLCTNKYGFIEKFVFDCISKVNYIDRVIELVTLQDDATLRTQKYSMKSSKATKSFQRYVTETHQFFKFDTVDTEILENCKMNHFFRRSQTSRSYIFDVIKTSREVYDSARRRAYSLSSNASPNNPDGHVSNETGPKTDSTQQSDEEVDELRKELEMLKELVQCVVCKDRKINRVFIPCMHIVCCEICASRLNQCPVCRKQIKICHHAYPKWMEEGHGLSAGRSLCPITEDQALPNDVFENLDYY